MTNPTPDNVKFVKSGVTVYLASTSVEENITNSVKPITTPTTGTTPNTTGLINLNKVEDRFTVDGWINQGKLNAAETYTDAIDKKNGLKDMFKLGTVVVMTYEGTAYNVAADKISIKDSPREGQTPVDNEAVYSVKITLVVGNDLVS